MKKIAVFARWPLGGASAFLLLMSVGLDLTDAVNAVFGAAIFMLAAVSFGAFIYAEGIRHREFREQMNAIPLPIKDDTQEET